ncbi:MAG: four helix bundle protein [Planctomycetota bacterium]|nr:MAG: four helix bundle protein [Planctomycetota bacterium]
MADNVVKKKSYDFALKIVRLCSWLKDNKHFELANQLLRSGTSVGANVEEALAGRTRKDFFCKMSIASKEARETNYWLRLLTDTEILNRKKHQTLLDDSEELIKILTSIVKTGNNNE